MAGPESRKVKHYDVFLASPGDVADERQAVRAFFDSYNRNQATPRGMSFDVIDWENYSTAGVGRPQELITRQTLERFRESLVLVIGIMDQRFGSESGVRESGTEEEFECAIEYHLQFGFPEVKWFFRDRKKLEFAADDADEAFTQWKKVKAFREKVKLQLAVFPKTYSDLPGFRALLEEDLGQWLNSPDRPWFVEGAAAPTSGLGDWPPDVLERLSLQLNEAFLRHMQAGEEESSSQARSRYVTGLLSLRDTRERAGGGGEAATRQKSVKEGPLVDFLNGGEIRLLAVAPGGGGKTTMLRQVAAEGAQRAVENPEAPIFLYVRLASFDRDKNGFEGLMELLSVGAGMDGARFESCWREGRRRITVLMDGMNEVAREYRSTCARAVATLLQNSRSGHSYVITSRPGTELEAMAANATENLGLKFADVMNFGPSQVEQYLAAQGLSELRDRITGQLQALATNPFLLWALTRTLATTATNAPNNRGSLFTALIDLYVFAQREQSKPSPRPTQYNYPRVKKPVLAALALKMIEDGVVEIAEDETVWQLAFEELLDLQRRYHPWLPMEPETFMPKDCAPASFLAEAVNNGVLIRDGERLRFMHESVQEYFAAVKLKDAPTEDLARRAPALKFGKLKARGSMFEVLVTWAGLAEGEQVAALVATLMESHPLLAAHVAAESKLTTPEVAMLRRRFFELTSSKHKNRPELGALGLAVLPSTEPDIVERLVEMLETDSESASEALSKLPAEVTIPALVRSWVLDSQNKGEVISMLRGQVPTHDLLMAQAILEVWNTYPAKQARTAELVSRIDRDSFDTLEQPKVQDALVVLAAEAELAQDVSRSVALDALRVHASELKLPRQKSPALRAREAVLRGVERKNQHRVLTAECADKDDEALQIIQQGGTEDEREAALAVLVERRSILAVEPMVRRAIGNPMQEWLNALECLPRKEVQRQLALDMSTVNGEELKTARQIAVLLEDIPNLDALAAIIQNSDEELRTMAIRSSSRLGRPGLDLVFHRLSEESSPTSVEAGLRVLADSRDPAAYTHLLDLLFDDTKQRHLARRDMSYGRRADFIHELLVNAGGTGSILERLSALAARQDAMHSESLLDEARRLLPDANALEVLRRMVRFGSEDVRNRARWALARTGYDDAWRELLRDELKDPQRIPALSLDVARNLEATASDPARRAVMVETCESVLRSVLAGPDSKRKRFALELGLELHGAMSIDWRQAMTKAALDLMNSDDPSVRAAAIPALYRFAEDPEDRILSILLNDSDQQVRQTAYSTIFETAFGLIEDRFRSALLEGNTVAAHRIAEVIVGNQGNSLRDAARDMMVTGDRGQYVSGLHVLALLKPLYYFGDEWTELSRLASQGFERHGVEETWNRFAVNAAMLGEEHGSFVIEVLGDVSTISDHTEIIDQATKIWPNDLEIRALGIRAEIQAGRKEKAVNRIQAFEKQFKGEFNHRWLADCWLDLSSYDNAIYEYREAIQSKPADGLAHFALAWSLFLTGDLSSSLESSRRAVELMPAEPSAFFNFGLTLLASGSSGAAEDVYRRGLAIAKRQPQGRQAIEGALADFPLLDKYPKTDAEAARKIEELLKMTANNLGERREGEASTS